MDYAISILIFSLLHVIKNCYCILFLSVIWKDCMVYLAVLDCVFRLSPVVFAGMSVFVQRVFIM